MNDSKANEAAAEPPLDCRVGQDTTLVDALIEQVMADYPGVTAHAQARYYEEVHQHLAPLARELERENARLRTQMKETKKFIFAARHYFLEGEKSGGWTLCSLRLALDTIDEGLNGTVPNATELSGKPACGRSA